MLDPEARAILVDQLRPPPGYTLSHAVATTFTLDLPTALIVPLSFAARQLAHAQDPLSVLEAVRSCADRVDIFAQAGNVRVPRQATDLTAFLEPMVHLVRRPRPGRLFHPKTWFLRFASEDGEVSHRLLVLSRNLTADSSWDTCLTLEGTLETTVKASNRPLAQLLQALPILTTTGLTTDRQERIGLLAQEVRRIRWQPPADVASVAFHVLGVAGNNPPPDFTGTRHLVVSPFCNEGGLSRLLPADSQHWEIISRQESLDALPLERTENATCHVLDAACGLSDDDPDIGELQGLHAKMFIVERGHRARTLIGSANATDAAFDGNVEILVELEGTKSKCGINALLTQDTVSFLHVLERYTRQGAVDDDAAEHALENALGAVAELPLRAQVTSAGAKYSWRLRSSAPIRLPHGLSLTAAPLTRHERPQDVRAGKPLDLIFTDLAIIEVTPFVLLAITDGQFRKTTVVPARLSGDPAGRLDEILANQMKSPADFIRFLKLLLGLAGGGLDPGDRDGAGSSSPWLTSSQGLFELIVRALAERPAALDGLPSLVARLRTTKAGLALLPGGFDELWTAVEAVRTSKAKLRS